MFGRYSGFQATQANLDSNGGRKEEPRGQRSSCKLCSFAGEMKRNGWRCGCFPKILIGIIHGILYCNCVRKICGTDTAKNYSNQPQNSGKNFSLGWHVWEAILLVPFSDHQQIKDSNMAPISVHPWFMLFPINMASACFKRLALVTNLATMRRHEHYQDM